jgi:hypothetical protein
MKKLVFVFIFTVLFAAAALALSWSISYEIVNADTLELIKEGTISLTNNFTETTVKNIIRRELGFASGQNVRTVNGVKQRLVWIKVVSTD